MRGRIIASGLARLDKAGNRVLPPISMLFMGESVTDHPTAGRLQPSTISTWSGSAREQAVQRMFTAIAGVYDLNNTLLSFGLHYRWKKHHCVLCALRRTDGTALDVGAGTADLALFVEPRMGAKGRVIASDLNHAMLAEGLKKVDGTGSEREDHLPAGQCRTSGIRRQHVRCRHHGVLHAQCRKPRAGGRRNSSRDEAGRHICLPGIFPSGLRLAPRSVRLVFIQAASLDRHEEWRGTQPASTNICPPRSARFPIRSGLPQSFATWAFARSRIAI